LSALVPSPPQILLTFLDELRNGDLILNTVASLRRVVIGFVLGAVLALALGALAGWFRWWGYVLNPIIDAMRPIPALAYISRSQQWGKPQPAPVQDVLVITAKNLATMTVDVARAQVDCGVHLDVKTDGPLSITLAGCGRTLTFH